MLSSNSFLRLLKHHLIVYLFTSTEIISIMLTSGCLPLLILILHLMQFLMRNLCGNFIKLWYTAIYMKADDCVG